MITGCIHYWDVDSPCPGKYLLQGICRGCGATRTFTGGIDEDMGRSFDHAASKRAAAWKAQGRVLLGSGASISEIMAATGRSRRAVEKLRRGYG